MGTKPSSYTTSQEGSLRLYDTVELLALPDPTWLVDNVIPYGGFGVVYGPPAHGKTFLALDIALCVASGLPWKGHTVKPGHVIYVSAEGGPGIKLRVQSWLKHYDISPDEVSISYLIESVSMHRETQDFDKLIARINEVGKVPTLIIIDTLARTFVGNENQQEDMGAFIKAVDGLREMFNCTVMIAHHTSKVADYERGSTALRGAADTMIACRKVKEFIDVTCDKQKDAEEFERKTFDLVVVEGTRSCILEVATSGKLGKLQSTLDEAADCLIPIQPAKYNDWQAAYMATGKTAKEFSSVFYHLRTRGIIASTKGGCWSVVVKPEDISHNEPLQETE